MLASMIREMAEAKDGQGEIRIFNSGRLIQSDAPSILIVDQDEMMHDFLQINLQRKGYNVCVAKDGMEGLELYEQRKPDVVITELHLPVIGGYQLMDRIRNSHVYTKKQSKIMVLTEKRLEEDLIRSFESGVSDYMTKPFSMNELEARMKRLLSQ